MESSINAVITKQVEERLTFCRKDVAPLREAKKGSNPEQPAQRLFDKEACIECNFSEK